LRMLLRSVSTGCLPSTGRRIADVATMLQSHHVIESSMFDEHRLFKLLAKHELIDALASSNRVYLPSSKDLADQIEPVPHRGKPDRSCTDVIKSSSAPIESFTSHNRIHSTIATSRPHP